MREKLAININNQNNNTTIATDILIINTKLNISRQSVDDQNGHNYKLERTFILILEIEVNKTDHKSI